MDDYSVNSLVESKNEWCARLVNILTPLIISGFNSIWKDAYQVALKNGEKNKYLMTFQNYLSQVPKWSTAIVQAECNRIIDKSGCNYLQDLLSCVHIIQLKALSCVRVGQKQRKVDIDIPPLEIFIHNAYINCARKIYSNVYLFETDVPSLQIQKNNRELELIVRECIINTVRDNVPTETILRAYMDETEEEDVETKEEIIPIAGTDDDDDDGDDINGNNNNANISSDGSNGKKADTLKEVDGIDKETETSDTDASSSLAGVAALASTISVDTDDSSEKSVTDAGTGSVSNNTNTSNEKSHNSSKNKKNDDIEDIEKPRSLTFNDTDEAMTSTGNVETIEAPKNIDRLEQISAESFAKRKAEEEEDDEEDTLKIGGDVMLELDNIVSLSEANF